MLLDTPKFQFLYSPGRIEDFEIITSAEIKGN